MAKKPIEDADTGNAQTIADTPPASPPAVVTETVAPPLPGIPDPIFAPGGEDGDRPMSGGSFIRLEDGTLIRNQEA